MPKPRERDLERTGKTLTQWLAKKLPDAGELSIEGLRGPSSTGFSSDTLMFDLCMAGGRREPLVVRLEPSSPCPVFPEYDVALQFQIMDALAATDVPVPRMRWLERDPDPMGAAFYVMDRIDGLVPTDQPPYHTGGWISELSEADRAHLWWSGLDAMAAVHRLDPDAPDFAFLERPPAGTTPIARQLDYYDAYLDWGFDRSRVEVLERALVWLRDRQPVDEPTGICWGDSRLANQIYDGVDCAAVIDWEMVFVGNPEADLAWWITLDRCFSEGIGVDRLPGLPDRNATIQRWQAQTGRTAANLRYYEVFAAFRFSAIMARIGVQMKYYEVLPADHEWESNNLACLTLARILDEQA